MKFIEPTQLELERTSHVLGHLHTRQVPKKLQLQVTVIGLLCFGRPSFNVATQWKIDPKGTIHEGLLLLKRHCEVVKWMQDTMDTRMPHEQMMFECIVEELDLDELKEALVDSKKLAQLMTAEFKKFVKFVDEARGDPDI